MAAGGAMARPAAAPPASGECFRRRRQRRRRPAARASPHPPPLLLLAALAAAAALCGGGGAAAAAPSATHLLQQGDAAVATGDWSQAILHYSAALAADAAAPAFFYTKRAAAYAQLRRFSSALKDLDDALELDGTLTAGLLSRGKLRRQVCALDAARSDFERLLDLKPNHSAAAKELATLGELQEAVGELEAAVAAHAAAAGVGGGGAEGGDGSSGSGGGDSAGADNASEHQQQQQQPPPPPPDEAATQALLDKVYRAAGPDCVPAQLLEAQLELSRGRYEEAVAAAGRAVKASRPGEARHLEALLVRGLGYAYLSEHDVAKQHFAEALRHDPDFAPARRAFNRLKLLDRKRAAALRALEGGEGDGDAEAAEAALLEALRVDPKHAAANKELNLQLCRARRRLGEARAADAVAACEAALTIDAGYHDAERELVRALIDARRFDDAVARARAIVGARQGDGAAHELLREAERAKKMAERKDYYAILSLPRDADTRAVKRAYRAAAKDIHPDKVAPAEQEEAARRFAELAEAYEVLGDDGKRAAYDRGDDVEVHGHHQQQWGGGGQQFTFTFNFG